MKIGLQIPSFTWKGGTDIIGPRLADIVETADGAGFNSLWVMDHFFQIPGVGQAQEPMLEGYSALSFMAAKTQHATLGTMVTGVIYRHPGILIKTVTTLDVLSGGRAILGIGAAWFEREALGLGVGFPPLKERFERLEETLQIAGLMWSGKATQFNGKHYQLTETLTQPQPISRPHPPILIGGMGEQKTLRMVAQYAQACNLFARVGKEVLKQKLEVLKRHCDRLGRDYDTIEKTALDTVHLAPGEMTADEVLVSLQQLSEIGVQHAIFNMPNTHEIKPLEVFGEAIIPQAAAW